MWEYFECEDGRWYGWNLNGSQAFLNRNGDEWQIAFRPVQFEKLEPVFEGKFYLEPPDDAQRFYIIRRSLKVALRPHLSDIPYLVLARDNITVHPGQDARFQVYLPPLLRFELEDGLVLGSSMSYILSHTWFGDKNGGTLCYSLPGPLDLQYRGALEPMDSTIPLQVDAIKNLVHCDIHIHNDSKTALELKRLAIYSDLLSIYSYEGTLYSDTVRVNTTADGSLRMGVQAFDRKGAEKLVAGDKNGISEVLIRRGVNFLKSMTGI